MKIRKKNISVGANLMSVLSGIMHLKNNGDSLLIDESRAKLGDLFLSEIGSIERNYLKELGLQYDIAPLLNLEKYLTRKEVVFQIDSKAVLLGNDPYSNFIELIRKFYPVFESKDVSLYELLKKENQGDEVFNSAYEVVCLKIAKDLITNSISNSIDLNQFMGHCSSYIIKIFHNIKNELTVARDEQEEVFWQFKNFIYVFRAIVHARFSFSTNDLELIHMVLEILSPKYNISDALYEDLLKVHSDLGGKMIKTNIKNWNFSKGTCTSIELNCYDSIHYVKSLGLFSSGIGNLPLEHNLKETVFRSIDIEVEINEKVINDFDKIKFQSSLKSIGSKFPVWKIAQMNTKSLMVTLFTPELLGQKIEFFEVEVISKVKEIFKDYPAIRDFNVLKVSIGENAIYEDRTSMALAISRKNIVSSKIIIQENIKNQLIGGRGIEYFGPMQKYPIGPLSSLLKLNRSMHEDL